ncbi:hypothetical protein ACFOOM_00955 [Streptomyces echinoruber]|uniref:Uncharacterized protein n=1 Tax=Streptomyces echinoruber TaxID=68898 RepID=A0A918QWL8_9ACTN|nr:hypothetical protein [Streptomyces echinoruber]GGZ73214.1 hypothetical protein GCM10010389_08430 [Streptomyces echinoruber]
MSEPKPAEWFYVLTADWVFKDGEAEGGSGTVQGVLPGHLTRWEVMERAYVKLRRNHGIAGEDVRIVVTLWSCEPNTPLT